MVMPFTLPWPGSTIPTAYTQTDCIWLFAPFNFNFLWSYLDVSIISSIFSPFLYFIDELSWETEDIEHSFDFVSSLGEKLLWNPNVFFPLLNFPYVPLSLPLSRYSTSSLPCYSIPSATRREMDTWKERSRKPKSR